MANDEKRVGHVLSPQEELILESALSETVDRIEASAIAHLESAQGVTEVQAALPDSVKRALKKHYKKGFIGAMTNHRVWDQDKHEVLKRADHVGFLAAQIALVLAVYDSLKASGAGGPGGEVHVRRVHRPVIDKDVAAAAAECVDCDDLPTEMRRLDEGVKTAWEWCSGTRGKSPAIWRDLIIKAFGGTPPQGR